MKVLFDPVYTGKPSTCSTSYLVWELIEGLINWRDDIYIYILYPDKVEGDYEELEFLSRYPERVTLIPHKYVPTDRVRELFTFNDEMYDLVSAGLSQVWDADVLVTSRIPQIPMFRVSSGRPVGCEMGTCRTIIGIDEMPIFSFRDTVLWSRYFDLQQLSAYQMSDGVIVNNLWTKVSARKVARTKVAPSVGAEILSKTHEAVPVKLKRLGTGRTYTPGDNFYVAFTGRVTGTSNFKQVAEVFRKHFSFPVGKNRKFVKFIISTQSESFGVAGSGDIDFIDVQNNNRDEFHNLLKTKAHVVVNLSNVEDFSLSTYEPLYYGVPVIVPSRDWAGFLGDDYPFRAKGFKEAYAMLGMLIGDYKKHYERFKNWERTTWKDLVEGEANVSTYEVLQGLITKRESATRSYIDSGVGGNFLEVVREAKESELDVVDIIPFAMEKGLLGVLDDYANIPLSRRQNFLMLKMLMIRSGFEDTNSCGVFRRVEGDI